MVNEPYSYEKERDFIFTEKGVKALIEVKNKIQELLDVAGAFREGKLSVPGNTFQVAACLDYLVEVGELICLRENCWGQYRVYSTPETYNK